MIRGLMTDEEWAIVEDAFPHHPFVAWRAPAGNIGGANWMVFSGSAVLAHHGATCRRRSATGIRRGSSSAAGVSLAYGMSCCRVWPIAAVNWTRCR